MGIGVLGPLTVEGSTATISRRDRVVLEALAACRGEVVTPDALVNAVWGEHPPASASKNLQGCVMRLRRIVGADAIETLPHGYRLALSRDQVDAGRFERLVDRGRELMTLDDFDRAGYVLDQALELWRGDALRDVVDWDLGRAEADRLTELRLDAEELRLDAALRSGEHARVMTDLMALVRSHPLRERRWALLALAQYQSGRQAEALRTMRQVRTVLAVELGLDPGPELVELERAILDQDPALIGPHALPTLSTTCPYPGLVAYQVDDADAFFGRDADVAACLDRLSDVGVLTVVGPSGCGKSSLSRAGVTAALERDGRRVRILTPGPRPLDLLGDADLVRSGTVLVVDQCEEMFAHLPEPARQVEFLDRLLLQAALGPLVLCIRADKLSFLAVHPAFSRLAERGLYLLGPMGPEDLRAAIEGPARQSGLLLEPGLVDLLMSECEGEPGALPLMSHALRECWERREGRTLTVAGYTETGGIREAVARSAEAVYEQVAPGDRPLVRDLMLRLVMPGPEGESVRSRLPRRLVVADAEHDRLVELLIGARLVTSDDGALELAHEALARAWPRLRGWLDDDTAGHRILRHLAGTADAWTTMGRPDSEVYRGARLAAAVEWRERAAPDLTATEREFLAAGERLEQQDRRSAEAQAHRERRVNRRLRGLLAAAAALLLVAVLAGLGALGQARRADQATRQSDSRLAGARGLLAEQPDLAVLLALAGVRLDDSPATRANLLATLNRAPQLIGAARGTGGSFWGMELSPDGRTLALYDNRSDIGLYDARTGQVRGRYDADNGKDLLTFWPGMSPIGFSPDGRLLAVGKVNLDLESVVLLDTRDFQPIRAEVGGLPSRPSLVNDVRFSPDGTRLAAAFIHHRRGSDDWVGSSVLVWDTADLSHPVNRIRLDGPAGLTRLAFGAGPDRLWTYRDRGGRARLASYRLLGGDRETERPVATPTTSWSPFQVRGDQRQIALFHGKVAVLMDTRTGKARTLLGHDGEIDNIAYSRDGRLVAAGSEDRTAIVWDTRTGALLERFRTDSPSTYGLQFSPDGRTLYTAGTDRQIQAWDVDGAARFIPRLAALTGVDLGDRWSLASPQGDHVAYTWDRNGRAYVRFVKVAGAHVSRLIDTGHGEYGASGWSPDGRRFATTGRDGGVRIWDPTGREVRRRTVAPGHLSGLAYEADGRTIVVSERTGRIRWLDAATLAEIRKPVDVGASILSVAVSPDGSRAFALTYPPRPPPPNETYPPMNHWALVDERTGAVRRGDLGVTDTSVAAFSPDGSRIALGDTEGRVSLLDAATGAPIRKPVSGHDSIVWSLAYGPTSRSFVTGAEDGSVSLWDGRNGDLVGTVAPSQDGPTSARLLADGRTVLISDVRGRLHRWDIRPEHWVEFGCALAGRDITRAEWREAFGDRTKQRICPSAPPGSASGLSVPAGS